jgi:branched-subunit amino acid aminotransferase/4-amino-4-deoxychorismate lyase
MNGRIRFLADHLDRIQRAFSILGLITIPQLSDALFFEQAIINLIHQNSISADIIRIKINIWRKPGGLFTPDSEEAETLISVQPQNTNTLPKIIAKAGFVHSIPNRFTPFSFFKGPYALHYVQAGLMKKRADLDEVILTDDKNNISECLVSNIFWIKEYQIFTPTIETGCVAGIMRLNVLRACRSLNIKVQEGFFSKNDLTTAELIFTSNVTGLRSIAQIEDLTFQTKHYILTQIENQMLL